MQHSLNIDILRSTPAATNDLKKGENTPMCEELQHALFHVSDQSVMRLAKGA